MKKIFTILVFTVISLITYSQTPTTGLIAWYPLTGGTATFDSTVAVDSSGNGHNGIIQGSPISVTGHDGLAYSAYRFNGDTSQRITLPAIAVQGKTAFSMFAWFKVDTSAGGDPNPIITIGGKYNPPYYNNAFYLACRADTWTSLHTLWFGDNNGCTASTIFISIDTWHFVGVVANIQWDTTFQDSISHIQIYLDSAFVFAYDCPHIQIHGQNNNFIGYFGYLNALDPWTQYNTFVGEIDNVMYYGRALTATEVTSCRDHPTITAVNNIPPVYAVSVYPNPSNGSIFIESSKSGSYKLYNTLGEIVSQGPLVEDRATIKNIPQGLYILKVNSGGTVQEKKVVVCR